MPGEQATLETQKQALFQRMLANPADLDTTFAYAEVSAKLGDNEAAVAALERMLLFNPNLARVDLELGALYFRMGSFEMARSYFDKALAQNPPAEVRVRVDQYMTEITTQSSPQRLTGYFMLGGQYQSDANVAPGSPLIHSPIGDVLLSQQFVKKTDGNIFGSGAFLYSYDLGTQDRDSIEVIGTGFMNRYFQVQRLDLGVGEITAGPRFNFPTAIPGVRNLSIKPYFIANEVGLGDNQYFYTFGAGIEKTATIFSDVSLRSAFEYRDKKFTNAPDRPISTGLDGNDKLVSISLRKPITGNSDLTFQFDFLDQETRLAQYSNKAYAGSLAYRIRYEDPTGLFRLPWETTLFASRTWDNYAAPDPCCNTSGSSVFFSASDRYDRRWRIAINHSIALAPNLALIIQAQRDIVSSNLSLYGYTSNSVLVGPQIRF